MGGAETLGVSVLKRCILGALAAILAFVPPSHAQYIIDGYVPPWGVEFSEIHRTLTRDLLDPRSAQYQGMLLLPVEGGKVLCGWMNWRGADGGYLPFVAFYYKGLAGGVRESHVSQVGVEDEMSAELTDAGCRTSTMRATASGH